jgi:hypothetical protein
MQSFLFSIQVKVFIVYTTASLFFCSWKSECQILIEFEGCIFISVLKSVLFLFLGDAGSQAKEL